MRINRRMVQAGIIVTGAMVAMATPAAASTTRVALEGAASAAVSKAPECEATLSGATGLVRCFSGPAGTTQFRAVVQCQNGSYRYGDWDPFGTLTSATCPSGAGNATRVGAQFR